MINYVKTKLDHFSSRPMPTALNHGIVEGGQPLVAVDDGTGVAVAKAATGVAGEKFVGFALLRKGPATRLPAVKTIVGTGAPFTTTLPGYIDGTARILNADGTNYVPGAPVELAVASNGTVTAVSQLANGVVKQIQYAYAPTISQVMDMFGDFDTSHAVELQGVEVGVFRHGEIFVTNYDTTQNWDIGDVPTLGAGAVLTKGGTGATAVGCMVSSLPSANSPFLGIEIAL